MHETLGNAKTLGICQANRFGKCLLLNMENIGLRTQSATSWGTMLEMNRDPQENKNLYVLAQDCLQKKRFQQALIYLNQLCQNPKDPHYLNALTDKAFALLHFSKPEKYVEEIIMLCEMIIQIDPVNADAHFIKGVAHHLEMNEIRALKCYLEAIELEIKKENPNLSLLREAYYREGLIFKRQMLFIGDHCCDECGALSICQNF